MTEETYLFGDSDRKLSVAVYREAIACVKQLLETLQLTDREDVRRFLNFIRPAIVEATRAIELDLIRAEGMERPEAFRQCQTNLAFFNRLSTIINAIQWLVMRGVFGERERAAFLLTVIGKAIDENSTVAVDVATSVFIRPFVPAELQKEVFADEQSNEKNR